MIEKLSTLPPYHIINSGLLLVATILCLVLWVCGFAAQRIEQSDLPRITRFSGSVFPHPADDFYTLCFICFFASLSLMGIFSVESDEPIDASTAWMNTLFNVCIFLPMALRYMALPPSQQHCRTARAIKLTFILLLSIYFATIALNISGFIPWLIEVSHAPQNQAIVEELTALQDPSAIAACCISSVIVAPVMEEFVFRGFVYNVLRQRAGIIAATLTSSLFFSVVHMSLPQTPTLFLFACAQCYLYEKTGTIKYPILLHFVFNLIATLAIFVFNR